MRHPSCGKKFRFGSAPSKVSKGEIRPGRQVNVAEGVIEGLQLENSSGLLSDVFLGIPFAEPPLGELRFRKPVPTKPWAGVRKCTRFGDRSVQRDQLWDKVFLSTPQSEDCLYLNVFAPALQPDKTYPVLFYIHGGGFMMDAAAKYEPDKVCEQLICKDIVVVTIQYRLGYLGYFSLGNDACKGNFGLWDQIAALQWTKRNISQFGGDASRITVAGQSAGGVSADLLSLSPHSRDLFQQKMVLGGNSFCHWAIAKQHQITEFCRRKAEQLGWRPKKDVYGSEEEESAAMLDFLRGVPAKKFACHMIGTAEVFEEAKLPLAPVIDGELLPESLHALRSAAPPKASIAGGGQHEALLFMALGLINPNDKFLDKMERVITRESKRANGKDISQSIRKIYGDPKNKKAVAKTCVTLLSDIISNYAIYKYFRHASTLSVPTYLYSFDHTSRRVFGFLAASVPFIGGTHASELVYLFDCNYFVSPLPMNKDDRFVAKLTPALFTNFVKNGDPNGEETRSVTEWKPLAEDGEMAVLSISTSPRMKGDIFDGRMELLDGFVSKFKLEDGFHCTDTPCEGHQGRLSIYIGG